MADRTLRMDRIIRNLQSPKAATRFDACEELRVESELPPDALEALKRAMSDTDALVAEAARKALDAHTISRVSRPSPAQPIPRDPALARRGRAFLPF